MASKATEAARLREDIEIVPTLYRGERAFLLRDNLGLIENPLLVQAEALVILGLLDGRHSVEDIQMELVRRRGGGIISRDAIEGFLKDLDGHHVLDSPRFHQARNRLMAEYARLTVRTPFLAGQSYPGEKSDLAAHLDAVLAAGPNLHPEAEPDRICGLAAPHIEIENGKAVYARAYNSLRGLSPERIILLGTGHGLGEAHFSITRKDFETPLGRVRTDADAVAILQDAGGPAVAASDIAHQREHSLEFQLIFLQHLFGPTFSLVPVLCGSFAGLMRDASRPMDVPGLAGFLGALKEIVGQWGSSVLCVAGIDFSHIGPKFGHREEARSLRVEAGMHDSALIEAACRGDVEGLWRESRRVKDRYNVCGFSSLACLLEILSPVEGVSLGREIWHEEPTHSAVSFAAILFQRPREACS